MTVSPTVTTLTATTASSSTYDDIEHNKQQVDEVCDLFSTTLHSLAADAAAIRQISCLAEVSGISTSTTGISTSTSITTTTPTNGIDNILMDPSIRELIELDRIVSSIEHKVNALREIVSEEKQALKKFERTLQQEANAQANAIETIMKNFEELGIFEEELEQEIENEYEHEHEQSNRLHHSHSSGHHNRYHHSHHHHGSNSSSGSGSGSGGSNTTGTSKTSQPMKNSTITRNSNSNANASNRNSGGNGSSLKGRRDSFDPRSRRDSRNNDDDSEHEVSLERVAPSELKHMSRNILGRISLLDLNEALEEIERVCHNKLKVMPQAKNISSNTLQRRYEYLKQQRANVDIEVEAHAGHVWVSEQELRENCAFFRHGEATARSTLSILCSLKRLKQIPGRNTEVTYICLTNDDNNEEP